MEELISDCSALKISALSKSFIINQYADQVTIGPLSKNAERIEESTNSPVLEECSPRQVSKLPRVRVQRSVQEAALAAIEKRRKQLECAAIETHKQRVIEFRKQQIVDQREQWQKEQELIRLQIELQESTILNAMQQVHDECTRKELEERTAAERKRQLDERNKLQTLTTSITKYIHTLHALALNIEQIFTANTEATHVFHDLQNELERIRTQIANVQQKCVRGLPEEHDLSTCVRIFEAGKKLIDAVNGRIKVYHDEQAKKQEELKKEQQVEEDINEDDRIPASSRRTNAKETYLEHKIFLTEYRATYAPLLSDASFKCFMLECKKAVNIPVNAISSTSSAHLLDKHNKLNALLKGDVVKIGDCKLDPSQHPKCVIFCTDLLARKFVLQGDLTISVHPEAAFPHATVIISLWNQYPDFGKLLLAHFYEQCPFLVPLHIERTETSTDEEYYRSLGYQYDGDRIEKQDKYLKRMMGIARLYFAIMVSHPRKAQNDHHPMNLSNGWVWMARVLNREPFVDITATLINCFLSVAGNMMMQVYGKQFRKMLMYLLDFTMPLLKEKDTGGPYMRLKLQLQECAKHGSFDVPKGLISATFW